MTFLKRNCARTALTIGLLLAGVGLLPAAALADGTSYGGNDWYMATQGVLALDASGASGSKPAGGAGLSAGFRFNRWLAAEIGGEWIDTIRFKRGSGPVSCRGLSGNASDGYGAWQLTGGGRVYLTESGVQPFVLGHAGVIQTRDQGGGRSCKATGLATRMGVGVDVFVTNGLAVSVLGTYVLPVIGGVSGHDYVSVGLGLIWY